MKATRKLLPAIALLLVSVVLLSTASFAWFTTNKTVKTTMTVSVTTPQNLMISVKEGDDWGAWANSAAFNADDAYPKLTPASSANGIDFVVSSGLLTEGALDQDAIDAIVDGTGLGSFENTTDGTGTGGEIYFLKYEFQLRASQPIVPNPEDGEEVVASKVTCAVTVTGANSSDDGYFKALRIVILDPQNNNEIVFATRGAESNEVCYPIVKDGDNDFKLSPTAYNNNTNGFDAIEFEAAVARSYTLVVWLEGNDPACISSNVDATPNCNISIDFVVEDVERQ